MALLFVIITKVIQNETSIDLIAVLWRYYLALLHPESLVEVKASSFGGLGLFSRNELRLPEGVILPTFIWGPVWCVDIDDFEDLKKKKYPSLYRNGVMGGPLSLINHSCAASMHFTHPRKTNLELLAFIFLLLLPLHLKRQKFFHAIFHGLLQLPL